MSLDVTPSLLRESSSAALQQAVESMHTADDLLNDALIRADERCMPSSSDIEMLQQMQAVRGQASSETETDGGGNAHATYLTSFATETPAGPALSAVDQQPIEQTASYLRSETFKVNRELSALDPRKNMVATCSSGQDGTANEHEEHEPAHAQHEESNVSDTMRQMASELGVTSALSIGTPPSAPVQSEPQKQWKAGAADKLAAVRTRCAGHGGSMRTAALYLVGIVTIVVAAALIPTLITLHRCCKHRHLH